MKRTNECYTNDEGEVIMVCESTNGEVWYPEKDEPDHTERTWDGFLQTLFEF